MTLIGVDGCPGGWLALAASKDGSVTPIVCARFEQIRDAYPQPALFAVDIPIGLPDAGPRTCDLEVRRQLGRVRGSSVFPAPLRSVLRASSWQEACETRYRIERKRMSQQAWGIVAKIREVDELLLLDQQLIENVVEVHPELSFLEWRGRPLKAAKKKAAGRAERLALIESVWPGEVQRCRTLLRGSDYAPDDLHDAFAALWTARRVAAALHRSIPSVVERDSKGLAMRIWV